RSAGAAGALRRCDPPDVLRRAAAGRTLADRHDQDAGGGDPARGAGVPPALVPPRPRGRHHLRRYRSEGRRRAGRQEFRRVEGRRPQPRRPRFRQARRQGAGDPDDRRTLAAADRGDRGAAPVDLSRRHDHLQPEAAGRFPGDPPHQPPAGNARAGGRQLPPGVGQPRRRVALGQRHLHQRHPDRRRLGSRAEGRARGDRRRDGLAPDAGRGRPRAGRIRRRDEERGRHRTRRGGRQAGRRHGPGARHPRNGGGAENQLRHPPGRARQGDVHPRRDGRIDQSAVQGRRHPRA
ncbi:hypothetical protein LTR94_028478, partial [Friedmanniomyces endolithicus]